MPHKKKPIKQRPKVEDESTAPERDSSQMAQSRRESGEPGGGAGRRDEDVGGSGVYPASSADAPKDSVVRTQGEWGQKLGGQVGGSSELNPYELGLSDEDLEDVEEK